MILHTLNCPPSCTSCQQCLEIIGQDDALLLFGDGVYLVLERTESLATLREGGTQIFVLAEDAAAAGVVATPEQCELIDMERFVALTERFERQLAWY